MLVAASAKDSTAGSSVVAGTGAVGASTCRWTGSSVTAASTSITLSGCSLTAATDYYLFVYITDPSGVYGTLNSPLLVGVYSNQITAATVTGTIPTASLTYSYTPSASGLSWGVVMKDSDLANSNVASIKAGTYGIGSACLWTTAVTLTANTATTGTLSGCVFESGVPYSLVIYAATDSSETGGQIFFTPIQNKPISKFVGFSANYNTGTHQWNSVQITLEPIDPNFSAPSSVAVTVLPTSGKLYQVAEGGWTAGAEITSVPTTVSNSAYRLLYLPALDFPLRVRIGYVTTGQNAGNSEVGYAEVSPTGVVRSSNFETGDDDWLLKDQRGINSQAIWNPTRAGGLSRFITSPTHSTDHGLWASDGVATRWHFVTNNRYLGSNPLYYGATVSFKMKAFMGDFAASQTLPGTLDLIRLECASCPNKWDNGKGSS